jgi:hypothetical protein
MDTAKTVTADFGVSCAGRMVKNANTSVYYDSISSAYGDAADGHTLMSQITELPGDLNFIRDISVGLKGGYNCEYSSAAGFTAVLGAVTIRGGSITVDKIIIK